MNICVVPIEGVLANGDNLKTAQPTRWARLLYDALHTQYRMIALTVNPNEIARMWLQQEFLHDWAGVMTMPDAYFQSGPLGHNNYTEWKAKQVEEFLAEGWEVGMVIDIVPQALEQISRLGVMTMLLSYPANKVGWRDPDQELRAWTDIVQDQQ